MSKTSVLKSDVEDYVRKQLKARFSICFSEKPVPLAGMYGEDATFKVDAVAQDESVLACISNAGGLKGGQVNKLLKDAYLLLHCKPVKEGTATPYLIFTNKETHDEFENKQKKRLDKKINLLHVKLSNKLQQKVDDAIAYAREEMKS